MKFTGVKLSKSQGSNTFTPEGSSFDLDRDNLDVVLNNAFMAVQNPVSGSLIKVEEGSGGKGIIRGNVRLENSFHFNPSFSPSKIPGHGLPRGQCRKWCCCVQGTS